MKLAEQYIKDVMDEKIVTGELIKLLVERHLNDLDKQGTEEFPYIFDKQLATERVNSLYRWRHSKGHMAGKRFDMQPWQAFAWYCLYGWVDEYGWRRFRKWYLSVARKNGKTEMMSTTANEELLDTKSFAPEIYAAATKKDQAKITFHQAGLQIKASQRFSKSLTRDVLVRKFAIVNHTNEGFFHYVGSDSDTMDGMNPQCAIIDEYHAHPTTDVLDIFESGQGARMQPLLLISTTAGKGKHIDGPCFKLEQVYEQILRGVLTDDRVLPMIYRMDKEDFEDDKDAWKNPELWPKSNPNMNVSVREDYIADRVKMAENEGLAKEIDVKTKNINLWVRSTIDGFLPDDLWMYGQEKFDESILEGKQCTVGIDVGGLSDFTAYTLYFPDVDGKEYWLFRPFVDNKTADDRTKNSALDFYQWEYDGHIEIIEPGDHTKTIDRLFTDAGKFNILGVAYDPNKSHEIIKALKDAGIECHSLPQTTRYMSPPTTELYKRFHEKRGIQHNVHPVARWQNSNAVLEITHNEDLRVHKGKSMDKVDIIVSAIMSYAMFLQIEEEYRGSYLNDDELIKI